MTAPKMKKPFPGYFTGEMRFFDAWGNEMCRAEDLVFLYQFYNGMFGSRYIEAQVERPGVVKSFMVHIEQLGWTRSGSIGPDAECDIRTAVVPLFPGGNFWIKNFMFAVHPTTPEEIKEFILMQGVWPVKEERRR